MRIISTNIGADKKIDWKGKIVTTGIFKFSVQQPIFLDKEDVKGDAVIDRKYHGGIDQAVYGYAENDLIYFQRSHQTNCQRDAWQQSTY